MIKLNEVFKMKGHNPKYIVVHSTGTMQGQPVNCMGQLPYNFLIAENGEIIRCQETASGDTEVVLAWIGGLNEQGQQADNRTHSQKELLFASLMILNDFFPDAEIVAASQLSDYDYPNPGFDLKQWLSEYIPAFFEA